MGEQTVACTKNAVSRQRERPLDDSRQRDLKRILIVEDVRMAETCLKGQDWDCDRVTHSEALSGNQVLTKSLRNKSYTHLWVSTPADWHFKH